MCLMYSLLYKLAGYAVNRAGNVIAHRRLTPEHKVDNDLVYDSVYTDILCSSGVLVTQC